MIIGAIIAALGTLATIAGSSYAMQLVEDFKNQNNDLTPDKINKVINEILQKARKKGSETLNMVNRRLSNIPIPSGSSSALTSYLQEVRNKAENQLQNVQNNYNNIEQKASDIQNRTMNFANLSADTKDRRRFEYENLQKEASDLVKQAEGGFENAVEKKI